MTQPSPIDYRQHLELETPEHVLLDYEIAGVGSRVAAAVTDWILIAVIVAITTVGFGVFRSIGGPVKSAGGIFLVLVLYGLQWAYFAFFEGMRDGQTPGKRLLGIRTIRDSGRGLTFADAATRALLTPIDLIGMIGIVLIAVHPKGRRLGDLVAGTVVVRDQPVEVRAAAVSLRGPSAMADELGTPRLEDTEFQLLREFANRANALPPPVRERFASQLAARFAERNPNRPADNFEFLMQLQEDELARRRGKFGGRGGAADGTAGSRSVAERLVARKSARWMEFHVLAERVTKSGLDALTAEELPDFATRYREVAADLARARVYGADPVVRTQLERLVAAGHSALYRDERQTWSRIWQFIARDCPAAVVGSWRYVSLAYLVFLVSAGAGYALLRERPSLAGELIPDGMLERAEAGAARTAHGEGFVYVPFSGRPMMAVSIIANNVRVAFTIFAGGVIVGIGSLFIAAYNGLELGLATSHFANAGMAGYIWTFIIGHGVLEISAFCFAAAAGLMLAMAIIAPGQLTRTDALTLAGRKAMRLIGSVFVMLIVAGLIEGFVSSSNLSIGGRIAVSAFSAVFLVMYLVGGWRQAGAGRSGPAELGSRK